ncbi:hypothetical protein DL96DRAFT_1615858 [Flagelloscypha sp. PMI_526]|nr:hypothetical protein DL96DRAFT_1615858 [Flagelloscypha sp. PMI_526]
MTSGTLFYITDGSQTSPVATSWTAYIPFHTTFAAGVREDGATTYIVSQVITRVDLFDSSGSPKATYTEPQTLVGTFVAGETYQAGTFPVTQTATPTTTGKSEIAYSCAYNVPAGIGECVNKIRGHDTTQQVTYHGNMIPTATFTPYVIMHQIANSYKPERNEESQHSNLPRIIGGTVGGLVGLLALIFACYLLSRRRTARTFVPPRALDEVDPFPRGLASNSRRTFANLFGREKEIPTFDVGSSSEHLCPHCSVPLPSSAKPFLLKEKRPASENPAAKRARSNGHSAELELPSYRESV